MVTPVCKVVPFTVLPVYKCMQERPPAEQYRQAKGTVKPIPYHHLSGRLSGLGGVRHRNIGLWSGVALRSAFRTSSTCVPSQASCYRSHLIRGRRSRFIVSVAVTTSPFPHPLMVPETATMKWPWAVLSNKTSQPTAQPTMIVRQGISLSLQPDSQNAALRS